MKSRIIVIAFSVAVLAASSLTAGEAVLSPRAKDNQIAVASGVASGPNLATVNRDRIGSPRALGNEIATVGGTAVTSAPVKCAIVGTPRQAEMFASCCKVAKANCNTTFVCCGK